MSLANIFPPVCDTDQKDRMLHYLVDGGYVNTVPVDVMKKK
jgi:predicted acylesterase/phospholipase RssA